MVAGSWQQAAGSWRRARRDARSRPKSGKAKAVLFHERGVQAESQNLSRDAIVNPSSSAEYRLASRRYGQLSFLRCHHCFTGPPVCSSHRRSLPAASCPLCFAHRSMHGPLPFGLHVLPTACCLLPAVLKERSSCNKTPPHSVTGSVTRHRESEEGSRRCRP